jgi:hypothetical protein
MYYYVHNFTEVDPAWTQQIIKKCGGELESEYKTYANKLFINQGVCLMPLTGYLGLQIASQTSISSSPSKVLLLLSAFILTLPGYIVYLNV